MRRVEPRHRRRRRRSMKAKLASCNFKPSQAPVTLQVATIAACNVITGQRRHRRCDSDCVTVAAVGNLDGTLI